MEIKLTLALPRDELSVPVVRRILTTSLQSLGVIDTIVRDIEVALTEACTNVLKHSGGGHEYEVACGIDGTKCLIEVINRGQGFDADGHGLDEAELSAESGRGIQLMRALVDSVRFENHAADGTIVRLEKELQWHDDALLSRLDQVSTVDGPWSREGARDPR